MRSKLLPVLSVLMFLLPVLGCGPKKPPRTGKTPPATRPRQAPAQKPPASTQTPAPPRQPPAPKPAPREPIPALPEAPRPTALYRAMVRLSQAGPGTA